MDGDEGKLVTVEFYTPDWTQHIEYWSDTWILYYSFILILC